MKKIKGGVTAAKGFEAASAAAGIKYQGRTDMALVYSQKPCEAAGTFTTNVVKAAPVKWDKKVVESNVKPQVVVINSGIANACTGETGIECCKEVAKEAAKALETEMESVLIGFYRSDWHAASGRKDEGRCAFTCQRKSGRLGNGKFGCEGDYDYGYKRKRSSSNH